MDRLRSIANLWNWLPAFRAVAETGNVRQAAERLHVSPSALSRTVRLLEDELGHPLFDRIGRALMLNAAGEQLLAAVRDSMRRIHDTTLTIDEQLLTGLVRIRSPGTMTHAFVIPSLAPLREQHPGLTPIVDPGPAGDPTAQLLLGDIDLALTTDATAHEELITHKLGTSPNGVYCGVNHPLHGRSSVRAEELASHPFVAPPSDSATPVEGWPAELPRTVGAFVSSLEAGLATCLSGGFLAVLPDVVAHRHCDSGALFRVPFVGLDPVSFYALQRPSLQPGGAPDVVLAMVREVVARELTACGGQVA